MTPLLPALVTGAATATTGLVAGLLYGFACAVMPGLRRVDDAAFVAVMRSINRRILNGWFLVCFLGAPVLTVATGFVGGFGRPIVAALALSGVSYLITAAGNVPLNTALDAAGDPAGIADTGAARVRFERRWVRWNVARSLASAGAFGCLIGALLN